MVDHWWRTEKLVSLLLIEKRRHVNMCSILEQKEIQIEQHSVWKVEGAPRSCTKWKTSPGRGSGIQEVIPGKKVGWLLQSHFLWGTAVVYQAGDLTTPDHVIPEWDWYKIPFLGELKLSWTRFGEVGLSIGTCTWGPVVLFLILNVRRGLSLIGRDRPHIFDSF